MTRFTRDEAGAGTIVSFIVAVSVFILAFSVVTVYLSNHVGGRTENKAEDVDLNAKAASALRAITTTPGIPADWQDASTAENPPQRFGLLRDGSASTLDATKFRALNRDFNTLAWYEEHAKELFGLEGYEFHLRGYPTLETDVRGNVESLQEYRVAYVNEYAGATPDPATTAVDAALLEDAAVDFTNSHATLDPSSGFANGDGFDLDAAALRVLALRLAGLQYHYDGTQTDGNTYWRVVTLEDYTDEGASPYFGAERPDRALAIADRTITSGNEDWVVYKSGGGSDVDRVVLGPIDLTDYAAGSATLTLHQHVSGRDSGGSAVDYARVQYYCTSGCATLDAWTTLGEWSKRPTTGSPSMWSADAVDLAPVLGGQIYVGLAWDPGVSNDQNRKGWFVKYLDVNATADSVTTTLYQNSFDYATTDYDAVVVGSGADQAVLNDTASGSYFSYAVQNWVTAGGDLIALGSDDIDNGWLRPTFTQGGTPGAAGPLLADRSDLAHPALTVPHALHYRGYDPYTAASYDVSDVFTKIILAEESGGSDSDTVSLLAVSNPNPDYYGTVILTNYAPTGIDDEDQQRWFLVNLLALAQLNDLYIDWGGTLPSGVPVGSATRTLLVDGSELGMGSHEEFLSIYVWR